MFLRKPEVVKNRPLPATVAADGEAEETEAAAAAAGRRPKGLTALAK